MRNTRAFRNAGSAVSEPWKEFWRSVLESTRVAFLGLLAFHPLGHVGFYVVDEDIKLAHGFVHAFLLELWGEESIILLKSLLSA